MEQYHGDGFKKYAHIQFERPVFDVVEIELHHFFKREPIAPGDLPEAGDAGKHFEAAQMNGAIILDFVRHRRAWADQAHLALKHVPKLRQFVDAELAQDAPDARDARVLCDFVDDLAARRGAFGLAGDVFLQIVFVVLDVFIFIRSGAHRTKFPETKAAAAKSNAFLIVKDRAGIGDFNRNRRRQKNSWDQQHEQHERDDDVKDALEEKIDAFDARAAHAQQRNIRDQRQVHVVEQHVINIGDHAEADVRAVAIFGQFAQRFFRRVGKYDDDFVAGEPRGEFAKLRTVAEHGQWKLTWVGFAQGGVAVAVVKGFAERLEFVVVLRGLCRRAARTTIAMRDS